MELDPLQTDAAFTEAPRTLCISPAGSGKTRVLVERIAKALERGSRPPEIVCITFTNAAANEIKERLASLFEPDKAGPSLGYVGTLHGYMLGLLRSSGHLIGLPKKLAVIDEQTAEEMMHDCIAECGYKGTIKAAKEAIKRIPFVPFVSRSILQGEDTVSAHYHLKLISAGMLTFDSILSYGAVLAGKLKQSGKLMGEQLLVDEYQDSGHDDAAIYAALPFTSKFFVGDPRQCHPPGVLIDVGGKQVPVETLKNGQHVRSWNRNAQKMVGGRRISISVRQWSGSLVRVSIGCREVSLTPNHRLLARWADRQSKVCVTYLMYRIGFGFRVGWCQLFTQAEPRSYGFHLGQRARCEKADAVWILKVNTSRTDASTYETIVATNFGLPQAPFEPVNGAQHLTEAAIRIIFDGVQEQNRARGMECLKSHGLEFDLPMYPWPDRKTVRATYFEVYACNVLPGLMKLPVPDSTNDWQEVSAVKRQAYDGPVYSLDVESDHSYAANGIVVLNSIYRFRGAHPENMFKLMKQSDIKLCLLENNYRSRQNICEKANRLMKHANRKTPGDMKAQKDGGSVMVNTCGTESDQLRVLIDQLGSCRGEIEQCAVLCKTNWQVDELAVTLRKVGIPVRWHRRLERPADWRKVKLLVGFLTNPENDILAGQVLREIVGRERAEAITTEAQVQGLTLNQHRMKCPEDSPVDAVPDALARFGVGSESIERTRRAIESLTQDKRDLLGLAEALNEEDLHSSEEGTGCYIGTIHSAKGREWLRVWVPYMVDEIWPGKKEFEDFEEERRLFYVALTRAIETVSITWPKMFRPHSRVREAKPGHMCRFIGEIGLSGSPKTAPGIQGTSSE